MSFMTCSCSDCSDAAFFSISLANGSKVVDGAARDDEAVGRIVVSRTVSDAGVLVLKMLEPGLICWPFGRRRNTSDFCRVDPRPVTRESDRQMEKISAMAAHSPRRRVDRYQELSTSEDTPSAHIR